MDCLDCQAILQRRMDGEPISLPRADLAAHLSVCPDCRDWYAAAQCLVDGLRLLAPPRPPDGMLDRICQQVMIERVRAARSQRLRIASAVAAGFFLVCGVAFLGTRTGSKVDPLGEFASRQPAPPFPSLHRRFEEAGLAVVALTRRTADETVGQTKLLLPVDLSPASVADSHELEQAFEPPVQSLREIQEGMSAGLEPVTSSARRAVGFFLSSKQWATETKQ